MRSIIIRLHRAADASATMTAMRRWLDDQRYEPSSFRCDRSPGWFLICVDFDKDYEADAFKDRFGGAERKGLPGTMAKVCWWRMMAEEMRTEADDFASASAKETLLFAARTLDRMANDLERRLEGMTESVAPDFSRSPARPQ
jgi:hypothetical protein